MLGFLYSYAPETRHWERFGSSGGSYLQVRFEDPQGRLWIGYESANIHQQGTGIFDPKTKSFTPFLIDAAPAFLRTRDPEEHYWFTTQGTLYRYTPATDIRQAISLTPPPLQGVIWDAMIDEAETLWAATLSGVYRLDPSLKPFHHLNHAPNDPNTLSTNAVMAIAEGQQGVVWIGTLGGGLNRLDRTTGTITRYRHQTDRPGSLCHDALWSLHEDRRGLLWIGTDQGLCVFDPRTQRFEPYLLPTSSTWALPHPPPINAIREDDAGVLWLAGNDGLYRLDPDADAVKHLARFSDEADPAAAFIQTLHLDREGMLWLGMFGNKFFHFNTTTEALTPFPRLRQMTQQFNEGIWAIHEDQAGILWLGSDKGLTRFDPNTQTAIHYTRQDGLPASVVYAILEDEDHRLWVSTNKGLARFTDHYPEAPSFRSYVDGGDLGNTEYNRRAALKDKQGMFYFGGTNGLTMFAPAQIHDNPHRPPIVITRIQISNQDTTVTVSPFNRDRLALSYRDYTVSFSFAALNYTNPEHNRYAYQLEGFDEAWIEAGARRQVQYTNIPPGDYVFRVKGSNNDGLWNEDGVALDLTVAPPFWQTWWFRTLVAVLIIGLLTAAYRYRVNQLLRLERMRLRIASDLHDDIGSKLSSIALMSELIGKHTTLPDRDARRLTKIGDVSREMVGALRDIVWLVNPDHDRTEDLVGRMHEVATTMLDGRLDRFDCSDDNLPQALSMALRRNIYLVFREAVHNIVKHAEATRVSIRLEADGNRLVLTITDDGVGFDPDTRNGGYGLQSMQARATQFGGTLTITSTPNTGTTLTLAVNAHK